MAKIICTECGEVHRKNRSKHLRDKHGLDTKRGGLVAEYFINPEVLGIAREALADFGEGDVVVCTYTFPLDSQIRRNLQRS